MSLTPVAPGQLATVVTHLVMNEPPPRRALPMSPLRLRPWRDPSPAKYRLLFTRVGAPWLWFSRLALSDAELAGAIGELHVVENARGIEIGMIELERTGRDCRIRFLGLVPELTGRGHGKWLLTHALALAWRGGTREVDLFTCSLDHPAALPAYLKAGFRATRRSVETFPDPRCTGLLPRTAAPQVPIVE